MLSVVTVPKDSPERVSATPEIISHATDIATARAHLCADLLITTDPDHDYRTRVLDWFDTARHTLGMIHNPDGSVDVWAFEAASQVA